MINIARKEECTGCGACVDICKTNAITFETDIEGFWYPKVNNELCVDCKLCEKTCPILHSENVKLHNNIEPIAYASINKDENIRRVSTSGGIFSALANQIYDDNGYICGAIYNDNFYVEHYISNKREDLIHIRGSKHSQSDMSGIYKKIKELLNDNELVLICAAPCQIAGLKLYLGKDYGNLFTVDFICLGINSIKIFHKHLESLEKQFGSKVISIQGKNKDLGWRSLAYKIKFANNRIYLKEGIKDNFTRGFIKEHINCRPACYECKFKGFPRISDITLGDFWGIENIDKSMDDNMGTSVTLLNSQKGIEFFEKIEDKLKIKEVSIEMVIPQNKALINSISKPNINREEFYLDLDRLPYKSVIKKYFKNSNWERVKKGITIINGIIPHMGISPKTLLQFLWLNFIRKNTKGNPLKARLVLTARYTVLDIYKKAVISNKGVVTLGYKRVKKSKLETRLCIEGNGNLSIEKGHVSIYYGSDILIFDGANLTFKGNTIINQNVQIICMDNITIGEDVMISRDVVIRDNDGGHEIVADNYKKTAPVIIENHVWIGQGAMIMKGVTIGAGSVIGAGAWVATSIKPNSLVMGDPSRTIQKNIKWKK